MLDMGFLPDLRRVIAELPAVRQTLFFSATMPSEIERLANAILRDPVRVRIAPVKATAELISQSVYLVPKDEKPRLLQHYLTSEAITRAIVFTRTKHGADRVTQRLNRAGIQAEAMHGDKSQAARQRTLANFKSNRTPVLVATGTGDIPAPDRPHRPGRRQRPCRLILRTWRTQPTAGD
jgi:ATP-dependent RNA helicase RhlE